MALSFIVSAALSTSCPLGAVNPDRAGMTSVLSTIPLLSDNASEPLAVIFSADYLGVPIVWIGSAILAVSAASLAYLVYAIRKNSKKAEKEAKGGNRA